MGFFSSLKKIGSGIKNFFVPSSSSSSNLLQGVSTAAGIASNLYGQNKANQANSALATDQMAFQERLSNTSHVRNVADLRAAGLNPLLSAQYGGSSTPSGSTARHESVTKGSGEMISGTARHLSKLTPEVALLNANRKLAEMQSEKVGAEASSARSHATINAIDADIASSWYGKLAKKAGVVLSPVSKAVGVAGSLSLPFMLRKFLTGRKVRKVMKKHKLRPKGQLEPIE